MYGNWIRERMHIIILDSYSQGIILRFSQVMWSWFPKIVSSRVVYPSHFLSFTCGWKLSPTCKNHYLQTISQLFKFFISLVSPKSLVFCKNNFSQKFAGLTTFYKFSLQTCPKEKCDWILRLIVSAIIWNLQVLWR